METFIKQMFEIYCKNHHPTRHIKYQVINFAHINKSVMAKKIPSTNLEDFDFFVSIGLTSSPVLPLRIMIRTLQLTKELRRFPAEN